jgi:hypothetical protein
MAKAFILDRGEYDKRKDEVKPDTPDILPAFPEAAPRNRLGLAQWLLLQDHPLTSRVTVNRFWQEVFGTGLVRSSGDFGITGELPSHPELLDWLAVEFRESGWDVKKLFKLMVTSAAYRQAATTTPEKITKDAANRLLSRGPRFRMDAEMVRDHALASSGLLVRQIGGPSVRPYQPEGVWEAVSMGGNTNRYQQDKGPNLYRRSMYWFWKRSAPPASLDIMNAPSRENCTVRRERTNTPLKPLFYALSIIPLIIPGILFVVSWIMLASPKIGLINLVLQGLFGTDTVYVDIYSMAGMIWVDGLHYAPIAFLLMTAAFRSMDPSLEESSRALTRSMILTAPCSFALDLKSSSSPARTVRDESCFSTTLSPSAISPSSVVAQYRPNRNSCEGTNAACHASAISSHLPSRFSSSNSANSAPSLRRPSASGDGPSEPVKSLAKFKLGNSSIGSSDA